MLIKATIMTNSIKKFLDITPFSDKLVFLFLCVVVFALSMQYHVNPELGQWILFHALLLTGYLAANLIYTSLSSFSVIYYFRVATVMGTIFTLYYTLGITAPMAFGWGADAFFAKIDKLLFLGNSPSLWIERFAGFGATEFFSFIYGFFIPYLYLSIIISCIGRPGNERQIFLNGLAVTYTVSFLGYLFTPAYGPVIFFRDQFSSSLSGGFFHSIVLDSIKNCGGPHGAFPSLHVGASSFVCLFDLKYSRLRGLTYLPLVILIIIATVFLRYHYVIDTVAGVSIALLAFHLATYKKKEETCSTGSFGSFPG